MIFVTVGTHEQQFDRLIETMDRWAENHEEEVVIQTGFSNYEPKYAKWSKLYPYQTMLEMVNNARIVITHGGPSSFIMPLQIGKIPIVVPRRQKFDEHVNDHQLVFAKAVAERLRNIVVVEETEYLWQVIEHYNDYTVSMNNSINRNNKKFCDAFEMLVTTMFE